MNTSYEYIDGNVILTDNQGFKYVTPNTSNMYEVVKQENLIEIIDNKINDQRILLENSQDNIKKYKKKAKNILSKTLLGAILVPIVSFTFSYLILNLGNFSSGVKITYDFFVNIMNFFHMSSQTAYESLILATAWCTMAIPVEICFIESSINAHKNGQIAEKNVENHLENIEFLQKEKEREEKKLADLKSQSIVLPPEEQKEEFKIIHVNNKMDYDRLDQKINSQNAYEAYTLKRQLKK